MQALAQTRGQLASVLEQLDGILAANHEPARRVTALMNQTARRLRQSEKQEEWVSALIDAALPFCGRAAIFTVQARHVRLERASWEAPAFEIPLEASPAIAEALSTNEPVVAANTPGQISQAFGAMFGPRIHLFPMQAHRRPVALLCADGPSESIDADALELVATIASSVWESRAPALPDSAEPDPRLRAQRFARVQAAEMRLYQSQAVKEGRDSRSLYRALQPQIDKARLDFQRQFLDADASIPDYLHLELVRSLANDDPELLGPDYPGPLA